MVAYLGVKLARLRIPDEAAASGALPQYLRQEISARPGRERSRAAAVGIPVAQRLVHARHQAGVSAHRRRARRSSSSPCDGTVQEIGRIEQDRILTFKGIEYTLALAAAAHRHAAVRERPVSPSFSCRPSTATASSARRTDTWKRPFTCPAIGCWSTRPSSARSIPCTRLNERMILQFSHPSGSLPGRHGGRLGRGQYHAAARSSNSGPGRKHGGRQDLVAARRRPTRRLDRDV